MGPSIPQNLKKRDPETEKEIDQILTSPGSVWEEPPAGAVRAKTPVNTGPNICVD